MNVVIKYKVWFVDFITVFNPLSTRTVSPDYLSPRNNTVKLGTDNFISSAQNGGLFFLKNMVMKGLWGRMFLKFGFANPLLCHFIPPIIYQNKPVIIEYKVHVGPPNIGVAKRLSYFT